MSGTPLRARDTIMACRRMLPNVNVSVVATGRLDPDTHVVDAWVKRARGGYRLSFRRLNHGIRHALAKIPVQTIHCFNAVTLPAAISLRRERPDIRVVLELHGTLRHEAVSANVLTRAYYRVLESRYIGQADHIIAMTNPMKEYLVAEHRVDPAAVTVLWGPVRVEDIPFSPPPKHDVFTVGYAGNAHEWQGLSAIVEAADLLKLHDDIRFEFVGFVPPPTLLRPNCTYHGKVEERVLYERLQSWDVLVSPRVGTTAAALQYPHKLSTYLSIGRPLIVTDVNDQGRIVRDAGCGFVIAPDDPAALAEAILQAKQTPYELRASMGHAARAFAERHLSLTQLVEKLSTIYSLQ